MYLPTQQRGCLRGRLPQTHHSKQNLPLTASGQLLGDAQEGVGTSRAGPQEADCLPSLAGLVRSLLAPRPMCQPPGDTLAFSTVSPILSTKLLWAKAARRAGTSENLPCGKAPPMCPGSHAASALTPPGTHPSMSSVLIHFVLT